MGPRNTNFRGRARGIIEKFLFVTLCWAIRAQPPPPPPPPPPFEEYIGREKKRKEKKTRHFNRETNNCCTVTTSIFRNDAKQNGTERLDSRQRFNSCVSFEAPSILPRSRVWKYALANLTLYYYYYYREKNFLIIRERRSLEEVEKGREISSFRATRIATIPP